MGKPQKVQPEVTGTLPAEFLPFARSLISYITGQQAQPYPNPYQQGLLGAFFGGGSQAGTTPGVPAGPRVPPPFEQTRPGAPGGNLLDFLGGRMGGGGEGIPGGGVPIGPDGRPLFGPAGTSPVIGGRANAAVMSFMERLFPGYAARATQGLGASPSEMAGPWGALGGRDAPWGGAGGTVGGLMDLRAESAARGLRIGGLMDEINAQRAEQGLPPL